ncbi:MAG: methylated-DNA--[Clostridiales bacterium]|nr:methylated-DNA--[protein]-cysteine S-methyltransferase [Clostridiales bacterium]
MLDIALSPIRVMDADRIRETSLLSGVTDDVPSFIRALLNHADKCFFVASVKATAGEQILGVLGLEQMSKKNRNANAIMYRAPELSFLEDTEETALSYYHAAWDHLLRYAFFHLHLHRVSVMVPVNDEIMAQIVEMSSMKQEAILEEALFVNDVFIDAALFSLLDSDYPDYSVGFVPYPRGVIAVRGDNQTVESTKFYAYESKIDDDLDRNVAIRTGIADSYGVLKPLGAPEYQDIFDVDFPDEVKKCMQELSEYFSKRRTTFNIHTFPPYGSPFQKKVWDEIKKIPYGVTRSYEDIALSLTGNDKIAARNMSRAVGSACRDNPLPILVPCHRVIGKDGKLVGFSSGLEYKGYLLDHEMFGIHIL